MNLSVKQRIYFSFLLMVVLFVANGLFTLYTLKQHRDLVQHQVSAVDPMLNELHKLRRALVESKMYTTNWVFVRSSWDDKKSLHVIHHERYPAIRRNLDSLSLHWEDRSLTDSLRQLHADFDELMGMQNAISASLHRFEDYDDPVKKMEAERIVEDEVFPKCEALARTLNFLVTREQAYKTELSEKLHDSSVQVGRLLFIELLLVVAIGLVLAIYLSRIIIRPINRIREIVNDLGKGEISRVNIPVRNDELGLMVTSVNHLSDKLHDAVRFADAIGGQRFDVSFEPIGTNDKLGYALVAMRDNLKTSHDKLSEAQRLAKLGNWEWDLDSDDVKGSDEFYRIFEIDLKNVQINGAFIRNMIHPDDRAAVRAVVTDAVARKTPFSYEARALTIYGQEKIVYIQARFFVFGADQRPRVYGVVQDITERKRKEEELRASYELYNNVSKATNDAVYDLNLLTNNIWWNNSYQQL
ncbi:MAG TPA: HAMP domain-containing protein, partial [Chitinophagales bacterium]|nr:HAMP domain-containing protein [Chitinophagales bacterium]